MSQKAKNITYKRNTKSKRNPSIISTCQFSGNPGIHPFKDGLGHFHDPLVGHGALLATVNGDGSKIARSLKPQNPQGLYQQLVVFLQGFVSTVGGFSPPT